MKVEVKFLRDLKPGTFISVVFRQNSHVLLFLLRLGLGQLFCFSSQSLLLYSLFLLLFLLYDGTSLFSDVIIQKLGRESQGYVTFLG